ncbi:MAG: hypothetical protein WCH39_12185 [Schlesneria sp.]
MLAFIDKLGLPLLHQAGREIEGSKIGLDSQSQEAVLERLLELTLDDIRFLRAAYRALQDDGNFKAVSFHFSAA